MEELSKMHKDVPFGWVLWLTELLAARRVQRFEVTDWREPKPPGEAPSDFHWLSAPH